MATTPVTSQQICFCCASRYNLKKCKNINLNKLLAFSASLAAGGASSLGSLVGSVGEGVEVACNLQSVFSSPLHTPVT